VAKHAQAGLNTHRIPVAVNPNSLWNNAISSSTSCAEGRAHGFRNALWTLARTAMSFNGTLVSPIVPRVSGLSWVAWTGAPRSLSVVPVNATSWRCTMLKMTGEKLLNARRHVQIPAQSNAPGDAGGNAQSTPHRSAPLRAAPASGPVGARGTAACVSATRGWGGPARLGAAPGDTGDVQCRTADADSLSGLRSA
jgi:hypothetical protein